jgi:superfamily II DNA or RNA helicase
MKQMYAWQRAFLDRFKDVKAFMLNACMGAGKTFALVLVAIHRNIPVIVICPKRLVHEWRNELLANGYEDSEIWVHQQKEFSSNKVKYASRFQAWLNSE